MSVGYLTVMCQCLTRYSKTFTELLPFVSVVATRRHDREIPRGHVEKDGDISRGYFGNARPRVYITSMAAGPRDEATRRG